MHCFNIVAEIPGFDPMEVEDQGQGDWYETTASEWHSWQPGVEEKKPVKVPEPELKRLMDLDSYKDFRETSQETGLVQTSTTEIQQAKSCSKSKVKTAATRTVRGPYRSYSAAQTQELLDLVIEQGISARQAGLAVGIVVMQACSLGTAPGGPKKYNPTRRNVAHYRELVKSNISSSSSPLLLIAIGIPFEILISPLSKRYKNAKLNPHCPSLFLTKLINHISFFVNFDKILTVNVLN
jgi:hypothetical protein